MAMYYVIVIIAFIFVQNTNPNYGVQNRIISGNRIIGGNRAKPNDFPWQALLTFKTSIWFCSGSVISTRNVLSSAHCNDREKV